MNARETDWAYAARSLVKVLAVTTALYLALSATDRFLGLVIDSDDERMAMVYGTAARVANPDKRLSDGYGHIGSLLNTTYTLRGEPRRAGPSEGAREYDIEQNLFGTVRAPSLAGPSGSLADALDAVESDPDTAPEDVRTTIDELPQTLNAVAVVEFEQPMTSERLVAFNRKHKICGGVSVSYIYSPYYYEDSSGDPPLNAIVWNREMPEKTTWEDVIYQCETEPEAALTEFRKWVRQLGEGTTSASSSCPSDGSPGRPRRGWCTGSSSTAGNSPTCASSWTTRRSGRSASPTSPSISTGMSSVKVYILWHVHRVARARPASTAAGGACRS
ncbi:hypothetical protein ACIBI9_14755 [Nonomuraea sp. NPDC050451]|uniref:hypothetical protein n=1 Tax=Nonomuraea sp. NPDC050451 TaxID=3364364 RepID=UPI0037A0E36F